MDIAVTRDPRPHAGPRRRTLAALAVTLLAPRLPAVAAEASLRILSFVPVGGPPDLLARAYAAALARGSGASAIVENRPGGGGAVAVAALKQARTDGTTLLLGHSGLVTMLPFVQQQLPYDPVADLVAVSTAATTGFALVIGPQVGVEVDSVAAFVRWARGRADLAFGAPGFASPLHVLAVLFARDAGIEAQTVPYTGGPQLLADLMGGRLAAGVLPEGFVRPLREARRLRVLATAGAARSTVLPDAPTLAESGFPQLVFDDWFGFFLPGGATPEIVEEASRAVQAAARDKALAEAVSELGMTLSASTPAEMRRRLDTDTLRRREAIARAGIRA